MEERMNIVSVHEAIKQFLESEIIVLWGASSSGLRVLSNLEFFFDLSEREILFYDSNKEKTGHFLRGVEIISKDKFLAIMSDEKNLCIVASAMVSEISKELDFHSINKSIYSHELIYTGKLFEKFGQDFIKKYLAIKDKTNLDADELFTLYTSSNLSNELPGEYAEVGVYKGGSACLVSHQMPNKRFFLFDTFEGLPHDDGKQLGQEPKGGWLNDTSVSSAMDLVKTSGISDEQIVVCKGYFPDETGYLVDKDTRFCLVHLDTDRYESTKAGLEFFYIKLSVGGRIIVHDYNCIGTPGVKIAVDEFVHEFALQKNLFSVGESQVIIAKL